MLILSPEQKSLLDELTQQYRKAYPRVEQHSITELSTLRKRYQDELDMYPEMRMTKYRIMAIDAVIADYQAQLPKEENPALAHPERTVIVLTALLMGEIVTTKLGHRWCLQAETLRLCSIGTVLQSPNKEEVGKERLLYQFNDGYPELLSFQNLADTCDNAEIYRLGRATLKTLKESK